MNLLDVNNLKVVIDGVNVLDDIAFSASIQDWVMICGPNGAGKSSLINAISRNLDYMGNIYVDGININNLKRKQLASKISVFSQSNYIEYPYTVKQVVQMGLFCKTANFFKNCQNDNSYVNEILELLGLSKFSSRSVKTLSGGELQRVFLAQALVQDPQVLLLDEPTNHLDLIYHKKILNLIDTWRKKKKRAVVCVMHDIAYAKKYATKALLIDHGSCVMYGSSDDVLNRENLRKVYNFDIYKYLSELYENMIYKDFVPEK